MQNLYDDEDDFEVLNEDNINKPSGRVYDTKVHNTNVFDALTNDSYFNENMIWYKIQQFVRNYWLIIILVCIVVIIIITIILVPSIMSNVKNEL